MILLARARAQRVAAVTTELCAQLASLSAAMPTEDPRRLLAQVHPNRPSRLRPTHHLGLGLGLFNSALPPEEAPLLGCRAQPGASPAVAPAAAPLTYYWGFGFVSCPPRASKRPLSSSRPSLYLTHSLTRFTPPCTITQPQLLTT